MMHSGDAFKCTIPCFGNDWRPFYDWNTVATTQQTATFLNDRLKVKCVRKTAIIRPMFLSGAISVKDYMNERVRLVHVCTDQIPHSIMVERFAIVNVAGLGAGTQFWKESGTLDRCEIAELSPSPNHILPGGRQRNPKSRGRLSGSIYIYNRALLSWAHYFLRIDNWFFSFPWGMNEKTNGHLVWRAKPAIRKCARRFFHSYLKETKNINCQFL